MTLHMARISVTDSHVLSVDGERYDILGRCDMPRGSDRFRIDHDGEVTERHIDWFADVVADADRVVIERGGQ